MICTIPTEYASVIREREERQDRAMAARGWVKVQDGMWMWTESSAVTSQEQSPTGE